MSKTNRMDQRQHDMERIERSIDSAIRELDFGDAIDWLEDLQSAIDGKIDGLRDDIKSLAKGDMK